MKLKSLRVLGIPLSFCLVAVWGLPSLAWSAPLPAGSLSVVTKSVAQGTKVSTLPKNLLPSLNNVSTDAPSGASCGAPGGSCVGGQPSGFKTVVVFGDSHAAMWFGSLVSGLGSKYHLLLKWSAGCPAANLTMKDFAAISGAGCNAWRSRAINEILVLHPSAVVIAERTTNFPTASNFTSAQWTAGLKETLQKFTNSGISAIVLGDNPSFQTSPAACVAQHLTSIQSCNQPAVNKNPAYQTYARAEQSAATAANAKFVSTVNLFCTSKSCPPIVNNLFVYYDWAHMSQTYALFLSKVISKETNL
ncbi:MAG: SGNH hydrolase domain-containing protein [Actinomycetota bacterium]